MIAVTIVSLVLGIMLATQFKVSKSSGGTLPIKRIEETTQILRQVEQERDKLKAEVDSLRLRISEYEQQAVSGESTLEVMKKELEKLRIAAGLTDVTGPGLIIRLDDSQKTQQQGENPNLFLIHDDDLLKTVNELAAAGAEAISINEQRIIATSEIRCAGPTISVNNTRLAPPYEIKAIGDPVTLENALRMRGGIIETLEFWGIRINIKQEQNIVIPAYVGSLPQQYIKAVQKEGE
ncbi:MAG TPA: DUF881 domain-containing protein [Clostridia bacterium]|jgi:uncharacterized protein YlxW (UPF0749 family)|nr:DUF881 domain-containing protein [Clostridia bacterium]